MVGNWQVEELLGINCVKGGRKRCHTEQTLCVWVSGGDPRSALLVLHHVTQNGISLLVKLIVILDKSPTDPHIHVCQHGTISTFTCTLMLRHCPKYVGIPNYDIDHVNSILCLDFPNQAFSLVFSDKPRWDMVLLFRIWDHSLVIWKLRAFCTRPNGFSNSVM